MEQAVKAKILAKMLSAGSINVKEYDSGNVSEERIDMWANGVQLLSPPKGRIKFTIIEQLSLRNKQLKDFEANTESVKRDYSEESRQEMIKHIKSQIKKLDKLVSRYKQEEELTGQKKLIFAKTQQEEVIRHLEDTKSITSFQAFTEYGITRLSAIIYNLRHDLNWDIETGNVTKKNRYGNTVTFAKYTIK